MITLLKKTLLNGATTTGAGASVSCERAKGWTFVIEATSVSSGATIDIQAEIAGSFFTVHSETITASGSYMVRDDHGHYEKIRANISTRSDGTYSVYARGTTHSL